MDVIFVVLRHRQGTMVVEFKGSPHLVAVYDMKVDIENLTFSNECFILVVGERRSESSGG